MADAKTRNNKKTRKPANIKDIKLEYLTGKAVDHRTVRNALGYVGYILLMAFAFLLVGMALIMDNNVLRILFNGVVSLMALMLFYQNGAVKGTGDVNMGEMLFEQKKNGHAVGEKEHSACFHPLKGFVISLLGSVPVVICCVALACVATRQMTGLGALPTWVSSFEVRSEIGNALMFYHQEVGFQLEDVLRVLVRMSMMPVVNMVSSYGADALLTLERLSALVLLCPAVAYGLGYMQGVKQRKLVHLGIIEGEKKRRKKEKRQRKAQQRQRREKGPQQLN
ncbi:MAG: hypothetical protein IJ507_08055 [Clostridia bacterium]|nr:hypothetical protein [Clostridia bacterium]